MKKSNSIPTSGLSIASLVFGLIALLFGIIPGIVGITLGIIALVRIRNTRLKGKSLAITGITLSIIGIIIGIFLFLLLFNPYSSQEDYRKNYPADADKFIGESIYENTYYNFTFTYPDGSIFRSAHPEVGFIVRFFLPNGQKIVGDEENIGVYIRENISNMESELIYLNKSYYKNGPVEIKEIILGGQKGYRVEVTSDYTVSKGTREMMYFTVKNNILYELNYFPVVNDSIVIVDEVANSFKFTK